MMKRFSRKILALVLTLAMLVPLIPTTALAVSPPNQAWYYFPGSADGSAGNPFIISTADELVGLQELVNDGTDSFESKYIQVATASSLDLSAYTNWTPIGTFTNPFKGSLDGNGSTLSHLTINDTQTLSAGNSVCLGLFGDLGSGGSVRNLTLDSVAITTDHTIGILANANSFVGGIAGVNEGTISHCTVSGTISVTGIEIMVGGIVGSNGSNSGTGRTDNGIVENSNANIAITASSRYQIAQVGGIAGISTGSAGVVRGCGSQGTVTAVGLASSDGTYNCSPDVGGLIGYANHADVSDSTSACAVTASGNCKFAYAGGLIGAAYGSIINRCSSSGTVIAQGGENLAIANQEAAAGGLVGRFSYANSTARISNCFSSSNVESQIRSIGKSGWAFAGGLVGYAKEFGGSTEINKSYASGTAKATALDNGYAFSGGFGGYMGTVAVAQCYSTGSAQSVAATGGYAGAGGFAGYITSGTSTSSSVSDCYSTGNASTNCVTNERIGGFSGVIDKTTTLANCYSIGQPTAGHTGAAYYLGASLGRTTSTVLPANCYYDSTVNPSLSAIGGGTGTITGLTTDNMADDGVLTGGMSGLAASGLWAKRTNTASERYYPELDTFKNAGGATETASKNSVKIAVPTYALTVTNGTGDGSYAAGSVVTITADAAPVGQEFDKWTTSAGGTFASDTSATTSFTVPANAVTVTATYKSLSPLTYALTVTNGSGDGSYAAGSVVTITADAAPVGQEFDKWTTSAGGTFASDTSATTSFTVPANAVTVTATYKSLLPLTYALTVTNGTGDGSYAAGSVVTITADAAPSGQAFDKWITNAGGTFASDTSATTTFTVPANAVTVTATYKAVQSTSGGSDTPPAAEPVTQPLTVLVTTTSGTETSSSANIAGTFNPATETVSAVVSAELAQDMIDKALEAKADGEKAVARVQFGTVAGATSVDVELPRAELKEMAAAKATLQLDSGIGTITLGARELNSIVSAAPTGSVSLSIEKVDKEDLSAKVQAKIKDNPIYRFEISVGETSISRIAGSAQITLPYTPPAGTRPRYVTTYYIDSNNVLRSARGRYDAKTGTVSLSISRM